MGLLPDHLIEEMANEGMIKPFEKNQIKQSENKKVVSYGVSSYGYDLRVADELKFSQMFIIQLSILKISQKILL